MGYNTTIIVLNDALHQIKEDEEFGRKVYNAALIVSRGKPIDIPSGNHCNAATVVETHHADQIKLIAVGGNAGTDLGYAGNWRATPVEMLRQLAESLGYRIVKKPLTRKP